MTTFTIAYMTNSSLLMALVADGEDVHAAVAVEAAKIGEDIARDDYSVESGLTLTNDDDVGEVVFRNRGGRLGDMNGFDYAVRL